MQYLVDKNLRDFEFWSGAKDNVARLTPEQLDELDNIMSDIYESDPLTETQINDLFWFDFELICEWLGIDEDEDEDKDEE